MRAYGGFQDVGNVLVLKLGGGSMAVAFITIC